MPRKKPVSSYPFSLLDSISWPYKAKVPKQDYLMPYNFE
uniref:Uncharacterized protein n=1 Tax=Anguilla anguilla TaxID=7936 RepID=A0A0E9QMI6_ANGAN